MRRTLSICLLGLVAFASAAAAEPGETASGASLSARTATVTIAGTSTMHDYALVTKTVKVASTLVRGTALLQPGALRGFELEIPVNSFTSEKDGLKKKMLETMKADKHPAIAFRMASYTVEPSADGRAAVAATGTLSVAGVEQPIELTLDVAEAAGGLRVKGTRTLSMKDFGIKPPTMFMGMLKTHDTVTITFDLHLMLAAAASN